MPIGAYSHSGGPEAAIAHRGVTGPSSLEAWTRAWLTHALATGDGLACALAARAPATHDWIAPAELNDLLTASRSAPTLRRASLNQGAALLGLATGWARSSKTAAHLSGDCQGVWDW